MQGSRTRPRRVTLLPRQWNDLGEKKKILKYLPTVVIIIKTLR